MSKKKINPKQQKAILALMENGSIEKAAEAVGISSRQLSRWLKQPEFYRLYMDTAARAFEHGLARLQRMTNLAASKINAVLNDENASTNEKLRAAELVLKNSRPIAGLEIDARLGTAGQDDDEPEDKAILTIRLVQPNKKYSGGNGDGDDNGDGDNGDIVS